MDDDLEIRFCKNTSNRLRIGKTMWIGIGQIIIFIIIERLTLVLSYERFCSMLKGFLILPLAFLCLLRCLDDCQLPKLLSTPKWLTAYCLVVIIPFKVKVTLRGQILKKYLFSISPELLNSLQPNVAWLCIITRRSVVWQFYIAVFKVTVTASVQILREYLSGRYYIYNISSQQMQLSSWNLV